MALCSLDAIREAEIAAQNRIATIEEESARRLSDTQKKADEIITQANVSAQNTIETYADKAHKSSEEVLITARNTALLDAERLRQECSEKQELVNKRIIELII